MKEEIIKKFKRFPTGSQYIELNSNIETQEDWDRLQKEVKSVTEK